MEPAGVQYCDIKTYDTMAGSRGTLWYAQAGEQNRFYTICANNTGTNYIRLTLVLRFD